MTSTLLADSSNTTPPAHPATILASMIREYFPIKSEGITEDRVIKGTKTVVIVLDTGLSLAFNLGKGSEGILMKGALSKDFPTRRSLDSIVNTKEDLFVAIQNAGTQPIKQRNIENQTVDVKKLLDDKTNEIKPFLSQIPGSSKKNNISFKYVDWQESWELKIVIQHNKTVLLVDKNGRLQKHYNTPNTFPVDLFAKSLTTLSGEQILAAVQAKN